MKWSVVLSSVQAKQVSILMITVLRRAASDFGYHIWLALFHATLRHYNDVMKKGRYDYRMAANYDLWIWNNQFSGGQSFLSECDSDQRDGSLGPSTSNGRNNCGRCVTWKLPSRKIPGQASCIDAFYNQNLAYHISSIKIAHGGLLLWIRTGQWSASWTPLLQSTCRACRRLELLAGLLAWIDKSDVTW